MIFFFGVFGLDGNRVEFPPPTLTLPLAQSSSYLEPRTFLTHFLVDEEDERKEEGGQEGRREGRE